MKLCQWEDCPFISILDCICEKSFCSNRHFQLHLQTKHRNEYNQKIQPNYHEDNSQLLIIKFKELKEVAGRQRYELELHMTNKIKELQSKLDNSINKNEKIIENIQYLLLKAAQSQNNETQKLSLLLQSIQKSNIRFVHEVSQKIKTMEKKFYKCLQFLSTFSRKCYNVVMQLKSKTKSETLVISPLQILRYMDRNQVQEYISNFIPPKILYEKSGTSFKVKHSYVFNSICNLNFRNRENFPAVNPQKINQNYRVLTLMPDTMLITGGIDNSGRPSQSSSIINLNSLQKIKTLGQLKVAVKFHSMGWLQGKPAVFGGIDNHGSVLGTVQVYEYEWAQNNYNLKQARYNCSVACSMQTTYVCGGLQSQNPYCQGLLSVQRFIKKTGWELLEILGQRLWSPGSFVTDQERLIICGGYNIYGRLKQQFALNTWEKERKYKKETLGEMQYELRFIYNLWWLKEGTMWAWASGKEVSASLNGQNFRFINGFTSIIITRSDRNTDLSTFCQKSDSFCK